MSKLSYNTTRTLGIFLLVFCALALFIVILFQRVGIENYIFEIDRISKFGSSHLRSTNNLMSILALAIFLLAIILGLVLNRALKKPIDRLINATDAISKGDFDKKIETDEKGYLGLLAAAIENMRINIKRLLENEKHLMEKTELALRSEEMKSAELKEEMTKRKKFEEKYSYFVYHDTLTGLPNRDQFEDVLDRELAKAKRSKGLLVLLLLDIDNFKAINDSAGTLVGDQLLNQFSGRLIQLLRNGDFIARTGGDEFAVIISDIEDIYYATSIAQKILSLCGRPFELEGLAAKLTASMGLASFPVSGYTAEQLMKNAAIALHHAKESGRNNFKYFLEEYNTAQQKHLQIENQLPFAIDQDEFHLVYQPIFDITTQKIVAAETLLRWNNKELGSVPPSEFIPIAEDTETIIPIGKWAITHAFADFAYLLSKGYKDLHLFINLSPRQLIQPDFIPFLEDHIKQFNLPRNNIGLEITETAMMTFVEGISSAFTNIREKGFQLLIDDFGSGYSSLNRIMTLKFGILKIDKAFIDTICDNKESLAIVKTIVALAKNLNLKIIAEGVETVEQLNIIKGLDCSMIQGFVFSKPMLINEFEMLLKDNVKNS